MLLIDMCKSVRRRLQCLRAASLLLLSLTIVTHSLPGVSASDRVDSGLVVLYDCDETEGATVHDRSGVGKPLHLQIKDPGKIRWQDGALVVTGSTVIQSVGNGDKLTDAIRRTNALSIEAWLTPADAAQKGPARIISLSKNPSERNVTLGQEADRFDLRLRTTETSTNGIPSTQTPRRLARPELTHVIATRSQNGQVVLYVNGKRTATGKAAGQTSNWNRGHQLILANEVTGDRAWRGRLHLVAAYSRALSAEEVLQNFSAGPHGHSLSPAERAQQQLLAKQTHEFNNRVAPLLARHCLECHDAAVTKGGLNLSRQVTMLQGGESGPAVVAGKAADSLLWQYVESGEMPKSRAPLSPEEQATLRDWIDAGAVWTSPVIDPATYAHQGHAGEVWVQRLTRPEYIETVRAAVGVDISDLAERKLPADLRADGFSNTAYNLSVDLEHIEAYGELAREISQRMDVLKFVSQFSRSRKLSTDDTMRQQVAEIGKWLFRGPLDEHEINDFSGIATTVASAGGDYEEAMRYIIEAMLLSPRFVYRIEHQRGSGMSRDVSSWELASRLSYIIWGGPPDKELFRHAESGDLLSDDVLQEQVRRMLEDPRSVQRSLQFIDEWLNLGRLKNLRPDAELFPDWDATLAADMRRETRDYFREVVWQQQRPLADLLNAQLTVATPRLARHYDLQPDGKDGTPSVYDLTGVPARGGLLTQASVLTMGGDQASMVTRGLFVLHDLLRGTVNAPPPCVNTTPPPTRAGLTQRDIAQIRIADDNCGVCHVRFEPLAFALEKFDGVGAYHERDQHGNELRDDGDILFPGQAEAVAYESSAQLMDLLAGNPRVRESLTWKVTQFVLGRPLVADDAAIVTDIHQQAQRNGGTWKALITAIVSSDLVVKTRTEQSD
jgi:hypothetical protein